MIAAQQWLCVRRRVVEPAPFGDLVGVDEHACPAAAALERDRTTALLSGLNLVGGRLLVTASYFETVRAVMSQSNWRFRTGGSVLDEGSGSPGWSASCWHRGRSAAHALAGGPFLHHISKS